MLSTAAAAADCEARKVNGEANEVIGERGAESRVQEGVEKDKDSAKKAKEREALEEEKAAAAKLLLILPGM